MADQMDERDLELIEKTIIVTGAGDGIGRAAAAAFVTAGASVVLVGRREESLIATADELPSDKVLVHRADVSQPSEVEQCVSAAVRRFGSLWGAFNNAGTFGRFGMLHEDNVDNFEHVVGTNLKGVWCCMKYQLPHLLAGGGGAIVNCASVAAHLGHANSPIYSATKHAIIGLSKSVALQYAQDNIRVNVISPGSTDTSMLRNLYQTSGQLEARAERAPMKRLGRPDEIAQAALFLISPHSSYITGQTLIVDGGVTAGSVPSRLANARK